MRKAHLVMLVNIKPVVIGGIARAMLGQKEHLHACRNRLELNKCWWERGARMEGLLM